MVYVNQIHLDKKGVKKNRTFFELLYNNEEIEDVYKWFDLIDGSADNIRKVGLAKSMNRKIDDNMTLDKFLKLMSSKSMVALQLASPDPSEIRYAVRLSDKNIRSIDRFAFIQCPYNDNNFNIVSRLYEESFGSRLEDNPVSEGLLKQYHERIQDV